MYWDEKRYSPRPGVHVLGAPLRRREHGSPERERQAVDVPQGKTKTVRLRQLPRGAVVSVAISVSGKLLVALVSAAQLKSPKPEPLSAARSTAGCPFRW
jgi:hypothetical protein